jgi:lysophospholipase L1-like esterase
MRPAIIAATLTAAAFGAVTLIHFAQAQARSVMDPVCAPSGLHLDQTLTRTRFQLTQGRMLTIVAIGSSSTWGAGASSGAASYPSRLEALLGARFPTIGVRVLNRGIGGEEETDMLARFDRDVVAEKPDLVLWQVGSNAIVRNREPATEAALIRGGIARLKETGADVVLIDPQYTAAIVAQAVAVPIVDMIAAEASAQGVATFRRFALMKDWHENQRIPFEAFSIEDGFHMNDWGYDCFARNLSAAIIDAAMPTVVASVREKK